MARDRSLDEFLSVEDGTESDAEGDAEDRDSAPGEVVEEEPEGAVEGPPSAESEDAPDPKRDSHSETTVEPIGTTYAWSPDGGECALCGETVGARWRDGGDLVCADCKNW